MTYNKLLLTIIIALVSSIAAMSQTAEKTVTLVVSGDGPTKDEAIKQALNSAIEQAFGTFVSANTQVLNDEIIRDEIVTISSGNITKYKEISTLNNNDGTYSSTVEATVSIGKLTNFARSKGMSVDINTGTFAMNTKIRELNISNEEKALKDLQQKMYLLSKNYNLFDYRLEIGEPFSQSGMYCVRVNVKMRPNSNFTNFQQSILSTLKALSITETEATSYKQAGFRTYDRLILKQPIQYGSNADNLNLSPPISNASISPTRNSSATTCSSEYSFKTSSSTRNNVRENYENQHNVTSRAEYIEKLYSYRSGERLNIGKLEDSYKTNCLEPIILRSYHRDSGYPKNLFDYIILNNQLSFKLVDNNNNSIRFIYGRHRSKEHSYNDDHSEALYDIASTRANDAIADILPVSKDEWEWLKGRNIVYAFSSDKAKIQLDFTEDLFQLNSEFALVKKKRHNVKYDESYASISFTLMFPKDYFTTINDIKLELDHPKYKRYVEE